jgi:hypothetical protein
VRGAVTADPRKEVVSMRLSAAERETVIHWSDADDGTAHIYTSQRPMMRKLSKHPPDAGPPASSAWPPRAAPRTSDASCPS